MTEPIWLELSLLLFAAAIGYLFSRITKQPVSIGLIIAGTVIGPSVLNMVTLNETVSMIAQLGGIVLMFLVGLESDFSEIYTKKALHIAIGGVALPFAAGFLICQALGLDTVVSLFAAASLTATSIGITAAVLKDMGKLGSETAKAILGAAVIDDVIGLVILAVVVSLPTGLDTTSIALTVAKAVAFIALTGFVGQKYLTGFMNKVDRHLGKGTEKETFILSMVIAFSYAFIAEAIGLSAIVGAFLAGVSLSKAESASHFYRGAEYMESVFTSIFFVSLGIIVNLSSLFTAANLVLALTFVAIVTKLAGAGILALHTGFRMKDAIIIGVGMVPRGEVALIIGLYGLTQGVIGNEVYAAIVLMSFLTTLFAPVVLKKLYTKWE